MKTLNLRKEKDEKNTRICKEHLCSCIGKTNISKMIIYWRPFIDLVKLKSKFQQHFPYKKFFILKLTQKHKILSIAKETLIKNQNESNKQNNGEITISEFKLQYKAVIIKTT